ncbi:cytochrome P450 [Thamnocephalis sphaerospora]|uniref:Cytochrome P450 n=1 Tax=Thamnocephalis sphaerospora TaxID=78915 RepID=A0A4P9XIE8_9FUNG|nr:cytochrome P450 [Thamnocephalis sphaerospora]|eukprot:RKP05464.1 cytochrome P450 [Thamnocephalis sphaerospora]
MALESLLGLETILVLLFTYALYNVIDRTLMSPLRSVPGPWYCAISAIFYKRHTKKGTQLEWIQGLHEIYGPVVRIAPRTVNVCDVDAAYIIHSSHKFVKGQSYAAFNFTGVPNIFSTSDPDVAKTRRKLVLPMFTRSAINEMDEMVMLAGIRPLLLLLEKRAESGSTADLYKLFHYMTFNVIGDIVFGRNFGLLKDGTSSDNMITWMNGMRILHARVCAQRTGVQLYAICMLTSSITRPDACSWSASKQAIRIRRSTENPRADSLQRYLTAMEEEKVERMTDAEIAGDMLMQLSAGSGTTAKCLTWTIYLLSRTPDVRARLLQELQEAVPDNGTEIRHAMVRDLPYLNAVIDESLRVYPVGSGGAPRVVPKGGVELCGKYVPGGTTVLARQYLINHSKEIWKDPATFRPERWLTQDSVHLEKMRRAFFPFSMGVRACVGRELAKMEIRVVVATLVRRFNIEVLPENDMTPICSVTVLPRGGSLVSRLTKRTE